MWSIINWFTSEGSMYSKVSSLFDGMTSSITDFLDWIAGMGKQWDSTKDIASGAEKISSTIKEKTASAKEIALEKVDQKTALAQNTIEDQLKVDAPLCTSLASQYPMLTPAMIAKLSEVATSGASTFITNIPALQSNLPTAAVETTNAIRSSVETYLNTALINVDEFKPSADASQEEIAQLAQQRTAKAAEIADAFTSSVANADPLATAAAMKKTGMLGMMMTTQVALNDPAKKKQLTSQQLGIKIEPAHAPDHVKTAAKKATENNTTPVAPGTDVAENGPANVTQNNAEPAPATGIS